MKRQDDAVFAAVVAGSAAALFFGCVADFAFPGESAHLMAAWHGLDAGASASHPLSAFFFRLLGGGNLLAPVCGTLAAVLVFLLSSRLVRRAVGGGRSAVSAVPLGRFAGVVAAVAFVGSPTVLSAATHIEPRLFALAWALADFFLIDLSESCRDRSLAVMWPLATGALWGLGLAEAPLFVAALPLALLAVGAFAGNGVRRRAAALTLFAGAAVASALAFAMMSGEVCVASVFGLAGGYLAQPGWMFLFFLTTLPFLLSVIGIRRRIGVPEGDFGLLFCLGLGLLFVLSLATPLAPGDFLEPTGILPVVTVAQVAIGTGVLAAFWRSAAQTAPHRSFRRWIAFAALLSLLAAVAGGTIFGFVSFEPRRGAFADRLADTVLDELGDRPWLVTDGSLDDHLLLAAERRGSALKIVSLGRGDDERYLAGLKSEVLARRLGGEKADELALSLRLGVRAFVEDWFRLDPDAAHCAAVFGPADLWGADGTSAVPERLLFGGDASRAVDAGAWGRGLKDVLEAPPHWGSHRSAVPRNPADRLRLSCRRYAGMVANNRGVWLERIGRADEARPFYRLVLDEIDPDNVSARFNAFVLSQDAEDERELKRMADDPSRRYALDWLERFYGVVSASDRVRTFLSRRELEAGADEALLGRAMRAFAIMQRADAATDPDERKSAEREFEEAVAAIGREAPKSRDEAFRLDLLRGFACLRKNPPDRTGAREAFVRAAGIRPEVAEIRELVLDQDIAIGDAAAAESHAKAVLRRDRQSPSANYILGSLALQTGDYAAAEIYLRKAADAPQPMALAMNDLAEVLRLTHRPAEAETYARRAVAREPSLYVAWETAAAAIMDAGGDLEEARRCIDRAVELSTANGRAMDLRMLLSRARLEARTGAREACRRTLEEMGGRLDELSASDRVEYDGLLKDVR